MGTSYPGGIDSFTNPVATNPMTSPDHATQHANENLAIEAIETQVGTTGAFNFLETGPIPTGVAATDTAAVQAVMTAAGTTGTAYLTQPGTFAINATLHCSGNLVLGPSTILQASTGLAGPVLDSPVGTLLLNVSWVGGTIDANGKAGTNCLYARYMQSSFIEINCINSIVDFVILGDPGAGGAGSFAITLGPNMAINGPGQFYGAGYSNLFINAASDNQIYLPSVCGAETGVRVLTGDNHFFGTHPNGNPGTQPMVQCFWDDSDTGTYTACTADTPSNVAHAGATGSNANNTITDAAIAAQHQGLPVTGTHIPAGSYVGVVTAGTSFTLVTSTGATSTPTGAVSGITLVGVGWNLQNGGGTYPNPVFVNCVAFLNASGTDNANYAVVVGHQTPGFIPITNLNVIGSSGYRWAAPFAGLTTSITWTGLQQNFVTTTVPSSSTALAAPVIFTSSGTWTPSITGLQLFRALVVGGGGNGAAGATSVGGGGGGGGEVLDDFYLGNVTTPQTVTIGGANTATSIGALVTAEAGANAAGQYAGNSGAAPTGANVLYGGAGGNGGASGTAAQGGLTQVNRYGAGGGGGGYTNASGAPAGASNGAAGGTSTSTAGGGGGAGTTAGTNGASTTGGAGATAPANTGDGGGGGGAGTVTNGAGGAGGSGYVIIYQVA